MTALWLQEVANLYAMFRVRQRMPPIGTGWSVRPDFVLALAALVQRYRPGRIVELGSGASTVWLAFALRELEQDAWFVSLEHNHTWARQTRDSLALAGLGSHAEVRLAPLVDIDLAGETYPWYDRSAFADVESCDLLVVDGPPGELRPQARYPAMPVMAPRMPEGSHILVDDYRRTEEREMVARWTNSFPHWRHAELDLEKGAALLTRVA